VTRAHTTDRFHVSARAFHWLTAVLVFAALIVGFALTNALADYAALLMMHKIIGALIFVIVIARVINRLRHHPPAWPATVGRWERRVVVASERLMYATLLAQPLVGYAMLTAAGVPVVIGSVQLPSLVPVDAGLYAILRNGHSVLAYTLVVVIAAHVSSVLLHTLTLRDGMLARMTFRIRRVGVDGRG
jgi:cytochrome b561